jgi:CRISPR-associated protein Cmr1
MNTLTATFRVVTPMFLGGAGPTQEAELRVPSIKGALRFWWRALMWWRGIRDEVDLRAVENELFGCSESEIGQSKILLSLKTESPPTIVKAGEVLGEGGGKTERDHPVIGAGARYLGYGLVDMAAGRLARSCLQAPFEFQLIVRFKPQTSIEAREQVENALVLLGLCGSLGSRSRRGFGSLTLLALADGKTETWHAPSTFFAWKAALDTCLGAKPSTCALPQWTALSPGRSRLLMVRGTEKLALTTLDRLGRDFVFFRSWGRNGKVLGKDSERRFQKDHDLMKSPFNRRTHPERIVFGLPHNYGKGPEDQTKPADPNFDRRASPLFLHIHQPLAQIPPIGIVLFLPSRFLPPGRDQIYVGKTKTPLAHGGEGDFWKPAHDFLERLRSGTGTEHFEETQLIEL